MGTVIGDIIGVSSRYGRKKRGLVVKDVNNCVYMCSQLIITQLDED